MKFQNYHTPVLIVNCKIGGLAILRSLGSLSVPIYGVDDDPGSPVMKSRYFKKKFIKKYDEDNQDDYLDCLLRIGSEINRKTILIPTSDELSVFVADHADQLERYFTFTHNDPDLVKKLISKEGMYQLALDHDIPTPTTLFPRDFDEVKEFAEQVTFPVMLKGIFGNRLQERTSQKMVIVRSKEELFKNYKWLEDPDSPNLMIQEYIPGGDDQVYIFNGYFNEQSECLASFTGFKIRQFPIHTGCASLGECSWIEEVANQTEDFMKKIGYKGILDIGYRLDPRDGRYKVLDINPRLGGAFRLFVAENDMDVAKTLYFDLTAQEIPPVIPREGRRWLIEDFDIISTFHYFQEGSLTVGQWMRSFKGVEEGAWFNWKDPVPFIAILGGLLKRFWLYGLKRLGLRPFSR